MNNAAKVDSRALIWLHCQVTHRPRKYDYYSFPNTYFKKTDSSPTQRALTCNCDGNSTLSGGGSSGGRGCQDHDNDNHHHYYYSVVARTYALATYPLGNG